MNRFLPPIQMTSINMLITKNKNIIFTRKTINRIVKSGFQLFITKILNIGLKI